MSIELRSNPKSISYTAAILQALQEGEKFSANYAEETGTETFQSHPVPTSQIAFARAIANLWADKHPELVSTILPHHDRDWQGSAEVLKAFRIYCLLDCILRLLENTKDVGETFEQKVTVAIEAAKANAANPVIPDYYSK